MRTEVVIVGGGLAGSYAALALALQGRRVTLYRGRAGLSHHWTGTCHLYGPSAPLPVSQSPLRLLRGGSVTLPAFTTLDERWAALFGSAPDHPFVRLAADPSEVGRAAETLTASLALPLLWHETAAQGASVEGSWVARDGGLARLHRCASRVGLVLSATSFPRFAAPWMAASMTVAQGAPCGALVVDDGPPAASLPIALARWLTGAAAMREALLRGMEGQPEGAVLVPALPGRDFAASEAWAGSLEAATGRRVLVCAAAGESPEGMRLMRHLDSLCEARGIAVKEHPVTGVERARAGGWVVRTSEEEPVDADHVVLATGPQASLNGSQRWVGRWVGPSVVPTRLWTESPWGRQPAHRVGIRTDEGMAVLDGRTRVDGLWAVGATLAGQDLAVDQTGFGVIAWSVARLVQSMARS